MIILSSTVISAIITTILTYFTNKRKDTVENIVKERKLWRDELRTISIDITNSKNLNELKKAINKLKVRINPYGMCAEIIFYDSYIWKEIGKLENCSQLSKADLEKRKIIFINLLSCLLKFDWERTKSEIKGNIQTKLVIISLCVCFIMYSVLWFWNYHLGAGKIIHYISYCTVYLIFVAAALIIIYLADKWKDGNQFISNVCITGLIISVVFILWKNILFPNYLLDSKINWIIFWAPFITLLYSVEVKMVTYMQNIRFYILSSMITVGETKINKKYKVFFWWNDKLPSGDKIEFIKK